MTRGEYEDIEKKIADGYRLSVYLEPNPEIESLKKANDPYIEAYSLPHICVQNGQVWGATRSTHAIIEPGKGYSPGLGFAYSLTFPLYCIFFANNGKDAIDNTGFKIKLLSARQYRILEPRLHAPGEKVWSSDAPDDTDSLAASIHRGKAHRAVFRDQNGILRSHPLDLTFLFETGNRVELHLEHAFLPPPFVDPTEFEVRLRKLIPNFDTATAAPTFAAQTDAAPFSSYRKFGSDGTGQTYSEILTGQYSHYQSISVFADP
ncbi:hypothetical protein HH303_03225 [Rhodospirillaceae bacterium KN72]|uniref:Uncharacterized protein n=1 Tax=Pacificispira spongiicola TaxID=2729598 RepID=A0A7Y0HDB1_9PROT|nr:hypothetical protein [Pacificispira spongiicola]NMM43475.1 hypothetical protein [Pacificispira spongiicola]